MSGVRFRRAAGDRVVPAPAAQPEGGPGGTGGAHRMSAALLWGGLFSVILWGAILAVIF